MEFLFSGVTSVLGLSRALFKTLLEHAVLISFFVFNGELFQQTEGLGMGLPLGPTFANIFLCHHEKKWFSECPDSFRPVFYRRYIDDTFILFKHASNAQEFLRYLNSKHPSIIFTMEGEQNDKLSFLDCSISKNSNKFHSSVYRKETFTGLGISFFSFCSDRFKTNSIKTLLFRAYNICSDYGSLHKEFSFLRSFFCNNGFTESTFYLHVNKFLSHKFNPLPAVATVNQRKYYISLPYFGPQSVKLAKELGSLLSKYFVQIDFQIVLVNASTIGSVFRFKDVLPVGMRSSLVYKYSCAQCASEYIGSTIRTLGTRAAEHAGRSFRTGSLIAHLPHSSVRVHAESCGTSVSISNFTILGTAPNPQDLRILESLHIYKLKPSLNDMQSSFPLKIVNH